MSRQIRTLSWGLGLLVMAASARAQTPVSCTDETCYQPIHKRTCTTLHPVVDTCFKRENYTIWKNVKRCGVRQEAYCKTVPKTCFRQVTRDEGCYKMVWCPKPVTRSVPYTTFEQRTCFRDVPYTFCERVPQICSRVVPEQRVRYVPRTTTRTCLGPVQCCAPRTTHFAPPCPPAPNCAAPPADCAAPHGAAYPPLLSGQAFQQNPVAQQRHQQQYATRAPAPRAPAATPVVRAGLRQPRVAQRPAQVAPPKPNANPWTTVPHRQAVQPQPQQPQSYYHPAHGRQPQTIRQAAAFAYQQRR